MNEEFELALVEEEAVAELQSMVIRILRDKKMTQKQLAEAMDVTPSYISQILSDEPQNLTIKRAASLFHHLGESLSFHCTRIAQLDKVAWAEKKAKQVRYDALQTKHGALPISSWVACNANDSTLYEQTFGEVAA